MVVAQPMVILLRIRDQPGIKVPRKALAPDNSLCDSVVDDDKEIPGSHSFASRRPLHHRASKLPGPTYIPDSCPIPGQSSNDSTDGKKIKKRNL